MFEYDVFDNQRNKIGSVVADNKKEALDAAQQKYGNDANHVKINRSESKTFPLSKDP